jgi:hypothetical protein
LFLNALVDRVKTFLIVTLMPRWGTAEMDAALFPPKKPSYLHVFAHTYHSTEIHIGLVLKYMAEAAGQAIHHLLPGTGLARPHNLRGRDEDDTAPGPPILIVALSSGHLHEEMRKKDHYSNSMQKYFMMPNSTWRPTVDSLRFEGDTCMPAVAAPSPSAPHGSDAVHPIRDPNATWQAVRGAVYLQLLNNPSVSLVK